MYKLVLISIAALFVLAACRPTVDPERCEVPVLNLVDGISTGLTAHGDASLRGARAVRSADFERVWFVAADIQAPGLEGDDEIAVWAVTGDVTSYKWSGLITSASGRARQFSDWGTLEATNGRSDDGNRESADCVKLALQ